MDKQLRLAGCLLLLAAAAHAQVLAGVMEVQPGSTSTPAAYVNSAQNASSTGTSTAVTASIPSGDLVVAVSLASGGGSQTLTATDSHSDSFTCTTDYKETSNNNFAGGCVAKAGAALTTVTCGLSISTANACLVAWYTPGSLAGTLDRSTGQDQSSVTAWTSGNTSTLTSSNELVIGFFGNQNPTGPTNTAGSGFTQRIAGSTQQSGIIEDKNVASTTAVAGTGTLSGTAYIVAGVMTIE